MVLILVSSAAMFKHMLTKVKKLPYKITVFTHRAQSNHDVVQTGMPYMVNPSASAVPRLIKMYW